MKLKVFFFLILGIINCLFSAFAYANSATYFESKNQQWDVPQQARVYIEPTQMHPTSEGIFVEIEGNLYQVAEICQDEAGYFVPYAGFWWMCRNGHPNPPWLLVCQACGAPRGT